MKKIKMKICPACKSTNITLYMGGHFGTYLCKECNYTGPLILEEKKKFKKKEIKKHKG